MDSRRWRIAQSILVVVAIGFLGRQLWSQWSAVQAKPLALHLRPGWIALSLLVTWLCYAALVEGWRGLVLNWHQRLPWLTAARIWILSAVAALIPGRIWGFAGMAMLSERAGVRGTAALSAAVVMQVLSIGTGVAVAALAIGSRIGGLRPDAATGLLALGIVALGSVLVLRSPRVLTWLWRLARRPDDAPAPPSWARLLEATAINLFAWVGYGTALWALAQGILPDTDLSLRLAIGTYAVSYIAGYLAVFTPGGLGVREVFITALLTPSMGAPSAIALSLASRLAVSLNQAGAAAPFLLFRESPRAAP